MEVLVDGKLFLRGGTSGSASTGEWIKDGMIFELREASSSIVPKTFRMLDLVRISADPQRSGFDCATGVASLSFLPPDDQEDDFCFNQGSRIRPDGSVSARLKIRATILRWPGRPLGGEYSNRAAGAACLRNGRVDLRARTGS